MKIKGIIVTGVGGGVGQSILKCLQESPYRIIGIDSLSNGTGLYSGVRGYLGEFANSDKFIDRLLEICKKESANVIFPGLDAELIPLSKNKSVFKDNDIEVIVSSEDVIGIADDKYRTYQFLKENNYFFPRTEKEIRDDLKFPVIVKPRYGGARSSGCIKCNNYNNLQAAIKNKDNFIIQEFIDSDEYTCGTVIFNGKCYGCIPAERELRCGDTYKLYFRKNHKIIEYLKGVIEKLNPYGVCNVQLRFKNNKCYIFEFNARCSGTTAARAIAGFNEPLWICNMLEKSVYPELNFREIAIFRYWKELPVETKKLNEMSRKRYVVGEKDNLL
jgi:carbamoyl-phosphate synthase large subunit